MTPPEPYDAAMLDVGDGHRLYHEQYGSPTGKPAVYLHGGPGSGATAGARLNFDPERYRAVLYDQRAAGRSRPHASDVPREHGGPVDWASIDLEHHIADLERLRTHLGIDRWLVFGISWGSGLAVAYAEAHPDRVSEVVIAAVGTGTTAEIDWLTVHAGRFLPEQWDRFAAAVPERWRGRRLVEAYRELTFDPDPAVHQAAADAWCRWEDAHMAAAAGPAVDGGWASRRFADPAYRLGFARHVTHAWSHSGWFDPDLLVNRADRLAGIPGWLIHGRLDVSSPVDVPWRLHRAWPGSELIVVDDEGHGGPTMVDHWRRILTDRALPVPAAP